MSRQIIYILGDVHGEFDKLNDFISDRIRNFYILREIALEYKKKNEPFDILIFQVGDFGYFWPGVDNRGKIYNDVDFLPRGRTRIYWCGGNHEDWDRIDALFSGKSDKLPGAEIDQGIFYCRFGSTLHLADGKTVLFAGGAESPDRMERLKRMKLGKPKGWWKQEGISDADMARLAYAQKADIVISHTAPDKFGLTRWIGGNSFATKERQIDNASRIKLNEVFDKFKPEQWFFGHFHMRMEGKLGNCTWMGLAEIQGKKRADDWTTLDIDSVKPNPYPPCN